MTPERWLEISRIYEAVDSAPPADQPALLARLCGADAALRATIKDLLEPPGPGPDPIHSVIDAEAADYFSVQPGLASADPHDRIGRYEIVRRIGQGGMGAVFEAMRVDDFQKRVALKIIRREIDSDGLRQRFELER